MKLPNYKRIILEDYTQEQQDMAQKLASVLNINIDTVYIALANRLTVQENLDATVKTFQITVDANGIPRSTTFILLNVINNTTPKASGSVVIRATNLTNSRAFPTAGVQLTFSQNREIVTIEHVTGLQANNVYEISAYFFH